MRPGAGLARAVGRCGSAFQDSASQHLSRCLTPSHTSSAPSKDPFRRAPHSSSPRESEVREQRLSGKWRHEAPVPAGAPEGQGVLCCPGWASGGLSLALGLRGTPLGLLQEQGPAFPPVSPPCRRAFVSTPVLPICAAPAQVLGLSFCQKPGTPPARPSTRQRPERARALLHSRTAHRAATESPQICSLPRFLI